MGRAAVLQTDAELRGFDRLYAPMVAAWVHTPDELFFLAPGTAPPLTAAKVVAWTRPTDRPLLLFEGDSPVPSGYAELNPLSGSTRAVWIGHVLVDPARRGRGLGQCLTNLLLAEAFRSPQTDRVVMLVVPDNEPAMRCYQACGFTMVGKEHHRFGPRRRQTTMIRMEIGRARARQFVEVAAPAAAPSPAQHLPA